MIFSVAEILAYISEYITLEPGDLIATGTPGRVENDPPSEYLTPGDEITIEIEGVGVLTNPVALDRLDAISET